MSTTLAKDFVAGCSKLTDAELQLVNSLAVAEMNSRNAKKQALASLQFKVGDAVTFKGKRGETVRGEITKVGTKTVEVDAFPYKWKVAPSMLTKI